MENSTKELLTAIAENQPKIKAQGFEEGKQAEYDAFWDSYQNKGANKQSVYGSMFFGEAWNDATFKPKYDIKLNNTQSAGKTFYRNAVTNIYQVLTNKGLKIIIGEGCKDAQSMFELCDTREIPPIETSHVTNFNYYAASDGRNVLHTIHELDMSSATTAIRPFNKQGALTNITFKGVIPISLDIQHSPLSPASFKSIIKHLKDYHGTDKDSVYTLTFKGSAWDVFANSGFDDDDYAWIESKYNVPKDEFISLGVGWRDIVLGLGWNLVFA